MPLLPLKLQALGLLAPAAQPSYVGAGEHIREQEEIWRRLRRRRSEEEILLLYGIGALSFEEADELIKV